MSVAIPVLKLYLSVVDVNKWYLVLLACGFGVCLPHPTNFRLKKGTFYEPSDAQS